MGSFGYSREGRMEKLLRDIKITQLWVGGPLLYLTELSRYYFGTETL
jgi:alkylation response protein AidB-like acyl-CoA dehydrogenase